MALFKSLFVTALITLLISFNSYASVKYTYTGNPFDTFEDSTPPLGTFTTSDFVSVTFSVPSLLVDLDTLTSISPITYTITDGRTTYTESSAPTYVVFEVATNSPGQITDWNISLADDIRDIPLGEEGGQVITRSTDDIGYRAECVMYTTQCTRIEFDKGSIVGNPGQWAVVPIPAAAWLFVSGFIGLIGIARRKRL